MTDEAAFDVETCLRAVRERDEGAARRLVDHFYPFVIRIVRAHLPRRSAEEDLAQDVFLKMFTRLDQYRGAVPFAHWLSRLTLTTCLDALRAQGRRPELRLADLSDAEAAAAEAAHRAAADAPAAGAGELVETLLARLAPEDRLIIRLLDLEERPVAEVARLTGWNGALIKVRAFRARRKLRQYLLAQR